MTRSWVPFAAAIMLMAGCFRKSDDGGADAAAASASAPASAQAPAGTVATFPDMIPQSGTRKVLQPITVHQAPDLNSPILTKLGVGTLVDLKGSRGPWMMIMWPSGVGQLSPGWVDLALNDARAQNVTRDAGAPSATPDAGKPDSGVVKPLIRKRK